MLLDLLICGGGGGDWCLSSLWLDLRGSLCSMLYICGACVLSCIFVSFCFSVAFPSYSPRLTFLHLLC
jgi:hypothetical protein